jgi:HD-like signal output (HDOD) protein
MKKTILFVDDEANIISGLKRMLRGMQDDWDLLFALGGEEALDVIAKNHVDVVVSDMRMPGMDGAELLSIVMERYPDIVRIILSGHSDKGMILRSVGSAHQYLAKPCSTETLKDTIKRSFLLRDSLNNENLKKVVTGIKKLPSLPRLYGMLVREMESPNASLKKAGEIIAQDVTMTARVLQLVNSAFFGLPNKIVDPAQAVILLGIDTLKALVLYIQVFSEYKSAQGLNGFSIEDLWQHSMLTGQLAKEITQSVTDEKESMDNALIAGILHDLGKLLLLEIPCYYKDLAVYVKEKECGTLEAEYALQGTSHAEVGAYFLGLWGIPELVIEAVAFHHHPSKYDHKEFSALTAVHVANALLRQDNYAFENVDVAHLESLNLTNKWGKWVECCESLRKRNLRHE